MSENQKYDENVDVENVAASVAKMLAVLETPTSQMERRKFYREIEDVQEWLVSKREVGSIFHVYNHLHRLASSPGGYTQAILNLAQTPEDLTFLKTKLTNARDVLNYANALDGKEQDADIEGVAKSLVRTLDDQLLSFETQYRIEELRTSEDPKQQTAGEHFQKLFENDRIEAMRRMRKTIESELGYSKPERVTPIRAVKRFGRDALIAARHAWYSNR